MRLDMLRRLAEVAAGDADADLAAFAQFRERGKRVRHVQGIMEVRHHDRCAQANRHLRCDGGQHHHLVAVANVVVDPNLAEAAIGAELRQAHEVAKVVVIGQMGDEL